MMRTKLTGELADHVFQYEARGKTKYGVEINAALANGRFYRCRVQGFKDLEIAMEYVSEMVEKVRVAKSDPLAADELFHKIKIHKCHRNETLERVFKRIQVYMEKTKCVEPETVAQYISAFRQHLSKYKNLVFSKIDQDTADKIYANYRSAMLFDVIMKYANILKIKYPVVFKKVNVINPRSKRRNDGKSLFEIFEKEKSHAN